MPKSAILKRTDETPPVRNGEFVATSTVLPLAQVGMLTDDQPALPDDLEVTDERACHGKLADL